MLLSEIGNKEIIDLTKGKYHGQLWDCELIFERCTGCISAILIPASVVKKHKKSAPEQWIKLPWSEIVKISDDMIIFRSNGC